MILKKAYMTLTEEYEVFVSYQHSDQFTVLELARDLDRSGRREFIDVHDDTLLPGQKGLDDALLTAIRKSDTMIVVVPDETHKSCWVPWEIGVPTPSRRPKALLKPQANRALPAYLGKLRRLRDSSEAYSCVSASSGRR